MDKTSQADCLMALANYALNGNEPDLTPEVRMFFTLVKPQLDANNKRYENGCKGGRPKNQTITKPKPKHNQTETKPKPNDNDNVNVNDNINNIYMSDFEEFWKQYPKQRAGSKTKAYSSYCRVIKEKRSTVDQLLASVKKYASSTEVKRGFAKGCAAWLNDDRFNNSYEVEKDDFSIDWEAEGFVFPKGRGAK